MLLSRFHFFWFLAFRNLAMMCLGIDFFWFVLSGIHSTSWICRFIFFVNFQKFLIYFFKYDFNFTLFLLFFKTYDTNLGTFLIVLHVYKNLFFFFHSVHFLCFSDCILFIQALSLLIISSVAFFLLLIPSIEFQFIFVLYSPNISICFFISSPYWLWFYIFCWDFLYSQLFI